VAAGGDASGFVSQYAGRDNSAMRKEQRAFSAVQSPDGVSASKSHNGGGSALGGRESALFNIREHSAMDGDSERKNVQALNLRTARDAPQHVSRFDATDDYTDLKSHDRDEVYTPGRVHKKGTQQVAAAAHPSAAFPFVISPAKGPLPDARHPTPQIMGHRTSKSTTPAADEPTLLIVNASGRFGAAQDDEEENFDMPENDFDGEKLGPNGTQSFNASSRPPRPSADVSGATTDGFGSHGSPGKLPSSYKKVHQMPQANAKKRYLAAGANSFNSAQSNRDSAGLRGANQTPMAMTHSSSAGSVHHMLQPRAGFGRIE
jgi:hypothetical protein